MVTEAGLLAIGIEPVVVNTVVAIRENAAKAATPKPPTQRTGTKQTMLIAMLQRPRARPSLKSLRRLRGWLIRQEA